MNVDKLTYAGNLDSLEELHDSQHYVHEKVDICDPKSMARIFDYYQPDGVMHLAAESHVDRSITAPSDFIQTNIVGTYVVLEAARKYFEGLNDIKKTNFSSIIFLLTRFMVIWQVLSKTSMEIR